MEAKMSERKEQAMSSGPMAGPGKEHERLRAFEGKFRAEVKLWMGPGDPMVSRGTMTNTMSLGGRFLEQVYEGDPGPGGAFPDFRGRGYWGFNAATRKYEGFWIDTASTFMQFETGDVDGSGKRWTMTGEMIGPDGKKIVKRSVITYEDRDRHSLEMFFGDGGKETKAMEIRYTRA
jgi:hypothetical protein